MGDPLQNEMRRVGELQAKAMEGLAGDEALEAGIRAGLDYAVERLGPDLSNLEAALGELLDGGSFLMGMQAAALASQGVDIVAAVRHPIAGKVFREYVAKARDR